MSFFRNQILFAKKKYRSRYSYLFDGVDEDILLGNNSLLNYTGTFSIVAWIKTTDLSHVNTIFFRSTSSPFTGYSFDLLGSGKLRCLINGGAGGNGITTSSTVLSTNTWYLVGMTKVSGAAPKIYVNASETVYDNTSNTNPTTNTANARIGGTGSITGWAGVQFEGNIDEIGTINIELSLSQFIEIYNNGKPKNLLTLSINPNVDVYYPMADGDTWDGTNWTVIDKKSSINGTSVNMEIADNEPDTP